ncbi:MAG: CocE/NonD family hydrolase [Halobacteriales archaeon]|nr:CocE/NonD family hydrolase [Halobacteriales archaeon]
MVRQSVSLDRADNLRIPTPDGDLAATRYRPPDRDGPLPVLFTLTPYRKDEYSTYGSYDPLIRYLADHGYAVVIADMLGTGGADGVKHEPFTADEGIQGKAAVEWLADQEWSTGRVGMFGKSYRGKTALHTAAEQPDGLAAIVPIMAPHQSYEHSRYPGGAMSFKHAGGWLPMMQAFAGLPPGVRDSGGHWADVWQSRLDALEQSEPWLFQQLAHPEKDAYWQSKDIDLTRIEVPMFTVGGWRDYFPHTVFEQARLSAGPSRVLIGPWRHTMPHRGRETAVNFRQQVAEWFDHFLTDAETRALERPQVSFWTERDGGGRLDGGVWRGYDDWPTLENTAEPVELALASTGLQPTADYRTDGEDVSAVYEFDHTVGMHSLFYLGPPTDTSPDDARSLTFETAPLEAPLEYTGTGDVSLRIQSTASDPLLAVRVVDVTPDDTARLVTYGQIRPADQHHGDGRTPIDADKELAVTVPLKPRSHVFERGHRLRIAISASFFPRLQPPRDHGAYTVLSTPESPSVLRFPGRRHGDEVVFEDTIAMGSPTETHIPTTSTFVTRADGEIERARELRSDVGRFRTTDSKTIQLPYGPTMEYDESIEWRVNATDPTTATVESAVSATIDYGTDVIESRVDSQVSAETAQIEQQVRQNDHVVFDHIWRY